MCTFNLDWTSSCLAIIMSFFAWFQVEAWLNKLLDTMQSTIRHEMTEAVVSYEEKPRDQWLFDPPAQVSYVARDKEQIISK